MHMLFFFLFVFFIFSIYLVWFFYMSNFLGYLTPKSVLFFASKYIVSEMDLLNHSTADRMQHKVSLIKEWSWF